MKTLLSFAFIFVFSFVGFGQAQKTAGIKDIDFNNFTYDTLFETKTVKLMNGKFEDGGAYDSGGTLYELFGEPIYGDLNRDKSEEAIVEVKMSAPSTLRDFEVQAFTFSKGQPEMLARINADQAAKDYERYYPKNASLHYAGINPPKIQNGRVILEALVDGNFACPKYTAVFSYKLSGGKFILSGKPTRKPFVCN